MSNTLTTLSNELATVVERTSRYVVGVHGHPRIPSSGVLWKPGVVITAEHALRRDDGIRVTLADGSTVTASLAGRDAGTDLAVLRIEHPSEGIERIDAAAAGDLVLAVGRTQNTGVSAVLGIISGVGGAWNTWRGGQLDRFIRLDLRLYPGLSGGAIVNASGHLIGMGTAGLSRTSPLAVPIATIDRIAGELLAKGHVARGYLGIGLQPVALPEHLKSSLHLAQGQGLIALSVEPEAPAGRAGVVIGDILVALDEKAVSDTDDVQAALAPGSVGKTMQASIVRGGELKDIPIQITERPRRRG